MNSVRLEFCTRCGEAIQMHWITCPVCGNSVNGNPQPFANPYVAPLHEVKEARNDLRLAGISMACLAAAGFVGFVVSILRGGSFLTSDQSKFGIGAIVFAAMVGGGLIGASKRRSTEIWSGSAMTGSSRIEVSGKSTAGINKSAAAKGALLGLLYSLGAIFLVMAIVVLIVVCVILFLIVTCMSSINR